MGEALNTLKGIRKGDLKMNLQFGFLGKTFSIYKRDDTFRLSVVKTPSENVKGLSSMCVDHSHVLFLEYDGIDREHFEEELFILQELFKLPPFYIFVTKEEIHKVTNKPFGNYHAINLKKHTVGQIQRIQDYSHCDHRYKVLYKSSIFKDWVLRQSTKGEREPPMYDGLIGNKKHLEYQISRPHLMYLVNNHKVDPVFYINLDEHSKLHTTKYKTAHSIKNA